MMPETDLTKAYAVGERLRRCIASDPFHLAQDKQVTITASVGIATLDGINDTPEGLLKRSDEALYCAKRDGRNRVVSEAA